MEKLKEKEDYYPVHDSYEFVPRRYPIDEEGYCVGFDVENESEELVAAFREYGVVVFNDAIPPDVADLTVEEVWRDFLEKNGPVRRDDVSTWDRWPWGGNVGMLGTSHTHTHTHTSFNSHPHTSTQLFMIMLCCIFGQVPSQFLQSPLVRTENQKQSIEHSLLCMMTQI